jgi:hypothetical protein
VKPNGGEMLAAWHADRLRSFRAGTNLTKYHGNHGTMMLSTLGKNLLLGRDLRVKPEEKITKGGTILFPCNDFQENAHF